MIVSYEQHNVQVNLVLYTGMSDTLRLALKLISSCVLQQ